MEQQREVLRCHACHGIQGDRHAYRDHLLRVHGKVMRRGSDVPVHLDERELAIVRDSFRCHSVSGPLLAARRRAELGLPRVSDREAERRLRDNRNRMARRHHAAARARGEAAAIQGALEVLGVTGGQGEASMGPGERFATRVGCSRSGLQEEPAVQIRGGVVGDPPPHARGASVVSVGVLGTIQRLRNLSTSPDVALRPPTVVHLPLTVDHACLLPLRHRDLPSCGGSQPSSWGRPRKKPRMEMGPPNSPGLRPKSSSVWGRAL